MTTALVKILSDDIPAPLSTILAALNWLVGLFCWGRNRRKEAEEWIQFYGSERLKLAVKLNLLRQCMDVYFQERIDLEWGLGWRRTLNESVSDFRSPIEQAMKAFLDAHNKGISATIGRIWAKDMVVLKATFMGYEVVKTLRQTPM
jgi:hypothetical protein